MGTYLPRPEEPVTESLHLCESIHADTLPSLITPVLPILPIIAVIRVHSPAVNPAHPQAAVIEAITELSRNSDAKFGATVDRILPSIKSHMQIKNAK